MGTEILPRGMMHSRIFHDLLKRNGLMRNSIPRWKNDDFTDCLYEEARVLAEDIANGHDIYKLLDGTVLMQPWYKGDKQWTM